MIKKISNTKSLFRKILNNKMACFACFLLLPYSAAAKMPTEKEVYLQLWSVREDIKADFDQTLNEVARIGFRGVEAAGYADGKFYGLTPAAYKKALESRQLSSLSSHTGKNLDENIANTNWNEIWNWWDTAIAAHASAGMKYIVAPWMPTPKTLADLKAYCDYYNKIGDKCNAAGLRFGYHNHDFEFTKIEGEIMYDFMLKNTDPSKVFFQMDVYWVVRGGKSPVDYFNTYPGRFELLHIKDNKELGQSGMVGFPAIFDNAGVAGAKYIIVEVENYNFKPLVSVEKSFQYLQNSSFVKNSYTK